MDRSERIVGAGLGQALGDSLGFHVERTAGPVAAAFVARRLAGRAVEPRRDPWTVGQVSDDTQLSLALVDALTADGGAFRPATLAKILVDMPSIVGGGSGTLRSIERLRRGARPAEAGIGNLAPSNGAAMRAWPLAAARLPHAVDESSRLTHSHPLALSCARAFAAAVGHLLDGGAPEGLDAAVAGIEPQLDAVLHELRRSDDASALWRFAPAGELAHWRHVSPAALPTVAWAVHAARSTGCRFEAAALKAVACGGDVDTTASMAGTLAGAHGGPGSLPRVPLGAVRDGLRWDLAGLRVRLTAFAGLCAGR